MPLEKRPINIPISLGIDTKTDPFQLEFGRFTSLVNCVFTTSKRISKRNGYGLLTQLLNLDVDYISTFNNNLVALGTTLQSYSTSTNTWTQKGEIVPLQLSTIPIVRSATNQTQADSVVSASGLVCTVFTDQDPTNLSANILRYSVSDLDTGTYKIAPTTISTADPTYGTPRVYLLGGYFIILFTSLVSATYHLNYIAISIADPSVVTAAFSIGTTSPTSMANGLPFDAAPLGNSLFIAWNSSGSAGIKMVYLTSSLSISSTVTKDGSHQATQVSVCVDPQYNYIWVSYYNSGSSTGYSFAVGVILNTILAAIQIISTGTISNLTSFAELGILHVFYEIANNYSFDSSLPTHYINTLSVTIGGSVGSPTTVSRSVGLASKAFSIGTTIYFLTSYESPYQSTYFLMDSNANVVAKLAYQNGNGYLSLGLPNVTVQGSTAILPYLYQFAISSVNKSSGIGVFGQVGINLVSFNFGTQFISATEIGNNLNITGGFLWSYDGNTPVEQNFHLWPDFDMNLSSNTSKAITTTTTSGAQMAQTNYSYIGIYEWQDNQGNTFRSGISLIVPLSSSSFMSGQNSAIINFPTLRVTYKKANPVKLSLFRASPTQTTYYQVTQISKPLLNDTTVDYVSFTDIYSDAEIVGNTILYTNGGVLENTGGLAYNSLTIFDNRLWGILSENTNVLGFSQPVIASTPVEMSQFLTRYVSPTIGTETSTGGMTCMSIMDDKLIIFKESAIDYMNGVGPDLTGSNNQYSEPIFVTATVGCSNEDSIVLVPNGLMFQSNQKGIWLLKRDLTLEYVGADVQAYTDDMVLSSIALPNTTTVLFQLKSGITLMFDYYYNQWGIFQGIPSVSSAIFQGFHTYLTPQGQVLQETPGVYLDISRPVLMSFKTGWLNLAGLQGFQRAYRIFLMGEYKSPHFLSVGIAYNYNPAIRQGFTIIPNNVNTSYGGGSPYGAPYSPGTYGGTTPLEQNRINFQNKKCQSFQLSVQEIFNPSLGIAAGEGLTLSGINIVYGYKKGYPRIPTSQTWG